MEHSEGRPDLEIEAGAPIPENVLEAHELESRKLDKEFVQSLWYASEKNIISAENIKLRLREYINKHLPADPKTIKTHLAGGVTNITGIHDLVTMLIYHKIDKPKLKAIHKKIAKTFDRDEQEKLSQQQIELINESVIEAADDAKHSDDVKKIIDTLLH